MRSLTPLRRRRGPAKSRTARVPGNPLGACQLEYNEASLAEGCAEETARTQRQAIVRFIVWADALGVRRPQDVSRSVLEQYQRHLYRHRKRDGAPLTVGSQLVQLAALKAWLNWLLRHGRIAENPAAWLKLPRLPPILPRTIPGPARIEALFALAGAGSVLGLRDRAILETFYSCGIRRLELVHLELSDADTLQGTLMVRHGKGRRDRIVPLGARACRWIERYLANSRPSLAGPASGATLFLDEFGRSLRPRYLGDLIRRYFEHAGIATRGACHVFRHAMATHMLDNGADIRHIQAILGHVRLETTQIYTRVSIRKLKEVHAATHPTGSGEQRGSSPRTGAGSDA